MFLTPVVITYDNVCVITEERPTVTIDRDVVTVTEGSTVTITCVATGVPTPVIRWTKSYEPLPSHHQVSLHSLNMVNIGVGKPMIIHEINGAKKFKDRKI